MSLSPSAPVSSALSGPPCVATTTDSNDWFRQEVHLHDQSLRSYIRRFSPSVHDVEDVLQESYLRIWKARLAHPINSTKSFLFAVARHLAIDGIRRRQAAATDSLGDLADLPVMEDRPGPVDRLCYEEKVELLAAAFLSLPPRCREIMTLRKLKGIPNKEIAAQLGLSEGTVENQITRGIKLCRDHLRKHGVTGFKRE